MTRNLTVNLFSRSQDMNSVALTWTYVLSFWIGKGFLGFGNDWLGSVPFCLSFNELASWPIWTSNLLIAWLWVFIIEAWVLDKVSIILSKSDNFLSGWFCNCCCWYVGWKLCWKFDWKFGGLWWKLGWWDWAGIDVEKVALVAHDQTDSMRNLDGSSILGCIFWSMDRS